MNVPLSFYDGETTMATDWMVLVRWVGDEIARVRLAPGQTEADVPSAWWVSAALFRAYERAEARCHRLKDQLTDPEVGR